MKRRLLLTVLCSCTFVSAWVLSVSAESLAAPNNENYILDSTSAHALMNEAQQYYRAGELFKARSAYQKILSSPDVGQIPRDEARQKLEELNMTIIFSRIPTAESTMYTVKPGDSLYKIAKKHDTTIELIQKANGITGSKIYPGDRLKIFGGTFSVFVDKSENILELRLNDTVLKTYRVATGRDNSSPVGTFVIKNKLVDPTWYNEGAVVPPDSPDNILGTRWLGFDLRGFGIHGTTIPESIGTQSTAGCVRMLNDEVEELYALVPVGTKVTMVD
jgi:lipoprotein-anchoring transpeptidase ErfK/SrfK